MLILCVLLVNKVVKLINKILEKYVVNNIYFCVVNKILKLINNKYYIFIIKLILKKNIFCKYLLI